MSMARRPRILDLYCCEGGAAVGYHQAEFDVIGIDIAEQPNYPFESVCGDAIEAMIELLSGGKVAGHTLRWFDAIHASPPCQAFSPATNITGSKANHPNLISQTRILLERSGKPWVMENVPTAPLRDPMLLCGTMFGLGLHWRGQDFELRRHRHFESNVFLMSAGGCSHKLKTAGSYGQGGAYRSRPGHGPRVVPPRRERQELLGIAHEMTIHGTAQAIPPAYTEFIGTQLLGAMR